MIDHIRERYEGQNLPLFAVGYSAGSSLLGRYVFLPTHPQYLAT